MTKTNLNMGKKKKYWFSTPEELCEYLNKRHLGNVYGGFSEWDVQHGGEEKGLIKTNYGMQEKWPTKLVALVAENRCSRCKKRVDYWDRVMAVDGDILDAWYFPDNDPPEIMKKWIAWYKGQKKDKYYQDKEIFWWHFD